MRKETSTNLFNQKQIYGLCNIAYTISLISGRWKPTILWKLMEKNMRYSELKNGITNISERILLAQLRSLENDRLIERITFAKFPAKTEYQVTALGRSLRDLLKQMEQWGSLNKKKP